MASIAKPFAVIDCETDPFHDGQSVKPFVWGVFDGQHFLTFRTTAEVVAWIEKWDGYLYAHNGGKFDFHFLLDDMDGFIELLVVHGRILEFRWGDAIIRDSMGILPLAQSKFSKTKIDYSKFHWSIRHEHMDEIIDYLRDDCVGLYTMVADFFNNHPRALTLASSAMQTFSRMYPGEINQSSEAFYNRYFPYYYGGRVSVFQNGLLGGGWNMYDINSAYPYAMLHDHPYGTKSPMITARLDEKRAHRSMIKFRGVAYGSLPCRDDKGRLIFPNDGIVREYSVPGYELLDALATDSVRIDKILECHTFKETINFQDYIYHFYEQKKAAPKNSPAYIRSKLFMNALYGKWAANPSKYKQTILGDWDSELIGYSAEEIYGNRQLFTRPIPDEDRRFYNIATAASITGFVRGMLWKALHKADTPVYCDTDSIICRGADLPLSTELGEWEIDPPITDLAIAGKKLYALTYEDGTEKKACKGVDITCEEIRSVAGGGEVEYVKDSPVFSLKYGQYRLTRTITKGV